MKSKKLAGIFAVVSATMLLASCGLQDSTTPAGSTSSKGGDTISSTSSSNPDGIDTSTNEKVTLVMSVDYEAGHATHMKFYNDNTKKVSLPYKDPAENTYEDGDFKPAWKELQSKLNFTIDDITPNQKLADNYTTHKTAGWKADGKEINIAQGNASDIISDGTNNDTFLDLNKYLDYMPNFKKHLEDNPVVKKTISNSKGQIFYAPYYDGFDDVERMLMLRHDWVKKLLDGDNLPDSLDDTNDMKSSMKYTAYMPDSLDTEITVGSSDSATASLTTVKKSYTKNIVATFNGLGKVTAKTAVKALRDWIDATYKNTYGTSRSDLFLGYNAAYDVDELVMLFRCIKLATQTLVPGATSDIVPLYPRQARNDRVADLWRFMAFFGARGTESRNGFFYVGEDGKLHDSRGEESTVTALGHMHEMYEEGLILQDFDDTSKGTGSDGEFRSQMVTQQLGFATYDYNQTSTILQDDEKTAIRNANGIFASVLPAVTQYGTGNNKKWGRYTESWRSVKPNGWFITKQTANDKKKLSRALKLVDYLYSDEGGQIMSYGPSSYLAKKADGVTIDTVEYMGKQVPKLSDATLSQMKSLTGGNYTNYYRYYVGATYPVGYIKEQGMEYQTVSAYAKNQLNTYENAIANGSVAHVNHKTDNTDHWFDIVPATLPYTEAENTTLAGNEYVNLGTEFNIAKGKKIVWSDIVKTGFGTIDGYDFSKENYCKTVNSTLKLTSYLSYANDAYGRFLKA